MTSFPIQEFTQQDYLQQGFQSTVPESSNRRQRISMACQYCRHRKIRCCGGAPCRNCTRADRECEYTPVPEEVNRATREKKASARASKTLPMSSAYSTYSPYMQAPPPYEMYSSPSPARPMPHRRTMSNPSPSLYLPPPAPMLNSPAMLESSSWMYNTYTPASTYTPSAPAPLHTYPKYPTVYAPTPALDYSPVTPTTYAPQSEVPLTGLGISTPALATPQYNMMYTPASSSSTLIETPPHTPIAYTQPTYYSDTLAPALQLKPHVQSAPLVGLGIGMPSEQYAYVPGSYFSAI